MCITLQQLPYVFYYRLTNKEKGTFMVSQLNLAKGSVKRMFFHVPKEVTWAGTLICLR